MEPYAASRRLLTEPTASFWRRRLGAARCSGSDRSQICARGPATPARLALRGAWPIVSSTSIYVWHWCGQGVGGGSLKEGFWWARQIPGFMPVLLCDLDTTLQPGWLRLHAESTRWKSLMLSMFSAGDHPQALLFPDACCMQACSLSSASPNPILPTYLVWLCRYLRIECAVPWPPALHSLLYAHACTRISIQLDCLHPRAGRGVVRGRAKLKFAPACEEG